MGERLDAKKALNWAGNNAVTLVFVAFTVLGFIASDLSVGWFMGELMGRLYRNAFLVISLIIPVVAGLGLNFGIVVGAMAGQIAIVAIRFFDIGGLGGLMLAFL
ncbi:MAG: ABC transporter permease, partial [Oscillospiraceae bacterium]|nr:ABC transporter permease [Oscillospiraceae bacterium]